MQEYLKAASLHHSTDIASTLREAFERLEEKRYEVILLDLSLPDSLGFHTFTSLKEAFPVTPIVILSGLNDEKFALEAVRKGAQDYLVKGQVDGPMLGRVIRYAIERKQAEEALRESEERYAIVVRGSNHGLWDWNLVTNSIYFSSRWKEMLGFADHEIGHKPEEWTGRIHPDDQGAVHALLNEHLKNATPSFKSEHRLLHNDGGYRWVLAQGLAVRDAKGKPYRMAGSLIDVTDRKLAEEKILYTAFHDALTGLPSRALFLNRLRQALKRIKRRPDYMFGVLFLDLDRFKIVNDSLGHLMGDQLLIGAARRLEACIRTIDTIARIGGDEFVILFDHIKEPPDAIRVAERIQKALAPPFNLNRQEVFTTASIGIAISSDAYSQPEEMMRDADTAMYRAKNLGGGTHQVFDQKMHARAVALLRLENDLRKNVEMQDFRLVYQPIVDLRSGKVAGFEALIRWPHPRQGILNPVEFIDLAEETGLIIPIGQWVLRNACLEAAQWQKQFPGGPPLTVSVNVSYKQLFQADAFLRDVRYALEESEIRPGTLCLEITESGVMKNPEMLVEMFAELRKLEVGLHIDDFGTGYSSLNYLHRFKIDKLKIDHSFLWNVGKNGENMEILSSIVTLAHNLKIALIPEGIETPEQLVLLRGLGCEYGQGYLFAKPMLPDRVEEFLRSQPVW